MNVFPLLACLNFAQAAGISGPAQFEVSTLPDTFDGLLTGLNSSDPNDQQFAVRELRRRVRSALSSVGSTNELVSTGAQQDLMDYDQRLAPVCVTKISNNELTRFCADILGLLETQNALTALNLATEQPQTSFTQRRIQRAIHKIEVAGERSQ